MFSRLKLAVLPLIVLISFSQRLPAQSLFGIDSIQLSIANQNFVYARECKEIKAALFAQLDTAESIITEQQSEIKALNALDSVSQVKYQVKDTEATALLKAAQKQRRKAKGNAFLLYTVSGIAAALVIVVLVR